MTLLRLQAAASRVPGLPDAARVLWLLPHRMLAALAVCFTAAAASILSARPRTAAPAGVLDRAARAGDDLYPLTVLNQGRRASVARRVRLTERDLRVLSRLLDVNFLSTSEFVLLGWGSSGARAGQRRLKLLHDCDYVDRFRLARGAGSSEWTYRLAARGFEELVAAHIVPKSPRYTPPEVGDVSKVRHDLELSALILRIALGAGAEPRSGLMYSMPFEWRGPRSGRVGLAGSEAPVRSEAATFPPGTRPQLADRRRSLNPDATLIVGSPDRRFAVLLEYDCSVRPRKQSGHLRRYDSWLLEGWRRTHFAAHAIAPAVVFLTAHEWTLDHLTQTADRVLGAWYGRDHAPREGIYPARERIVFTSRKRILSGDWTMQRVPGLPPSLRDAPDVCKLRSLVFDLPSLFANRRPSDLGVLSRDLDEQ